MSQNGSHDELWHAFLEIAPAGVAILGRDMRYLAASARWKQDFGLEGQDIIGRSHYEVFPEIPERWKEIHRRCLAGAFERCDTDPFPRADGGLDWVRWEIRPWHHGREIGGIVIFSELITERVEAEAKLRASEERFRQVVEAAPNLVTADDGTIELVNAQTERIFGYSRTELLGRSIEMLVPERFRRSHRTLHTGFHAGPRARQMGTGRELHGLRKDGSEFPVEVGLSPIKADAGWSVLASIIDLSRRKQEELTLRAMVGRLREGGIRHRHHRRRH